jgi:membrane protein DedA with SNARE-associated domain
MFDGLVHPVLQFVAVFLSMILETAFFLHFAPSEVVVPVAASQLVDDPLSFGLFVAVTTAGATVGSFLAYVLFGRYGERVLERGQTVLRRYGESSVFWARMFPLLRALISISAGLSEMDARRFVLYSTAGAAIFTTGLTYLVYTGVGTTSPLGIVLDAIRTELGDWLAYTQLHTSFVVVLGALVLLLAAVTWLARDRIRSNPAVAKLVGLHAVRLLALFVGGVFVLGALSTPTQSFDVLTGLWDWPRSLTVFGFSDQLALLLTGLFVVLAGLSVYELGKMTELSALRSLYERLVNRVRR